MGGFKSLFRRRGEDSAQNSVQVEASPSLNPRLTTCHDALHAPRQARPQWGTALGTSSYATSGYATPSYATPSHATPSYATPSYATPSYATPSYATPSYATPSYATPSYATPSYATTGTHVPSLLDYLRDGYYEETPHNIYQPKADEYQMPKSVNRDQQRTPPPYYLADGTGPESFVEYYRASFQSRLGSMVRSSMRPAPDHNAHHRNSLGRNAPGWYRPGPKTTFDEQGRPAHLCPTCRNIDLQYLFYDSEPGLTASPEDYIALGPLKDIMLKKECGLCRLVAGIACSYLESSKSEIERPSSPSTLAESSRSNWYLSPFRYSHKQYGPGFQLFLRRDVFDEVETEDADYMSPSYRFGIRLVTNEARGGRTVPPDQMDFGWVKRTIQLCDLSTDKPPARFMHPVRAIDVLNFCVAELPSNSRYVALSYPWGKAAQLKLTRETQHIQNRGGLSMVFDRIPRTIQDAITFVSKIGERYLWVDSLCIMQDDATDVRKQMEQMGEIYLHAILTVFAVSGNDANYGLPMVRAGTRKYKQSPEKVQGMWITNMLPWIEEDEFKGSWDKRGWTFQERLRSQRSLFVADEGLIFNCMHVYSPEDEHCWHTLHRNEDMIAKGSYYFYEGPNKGCIPYIMDTTSFDVYAFMVSGYTRRHLTYQADALLAFLGVLDRLDGSFGSGTPWIHALPEAELDAALLWSPIGSSVRRCDPDTGEAIFPSWSWLGWVGHAAYPWTVERDSFMSTVTSPLTWESAAESLPDQWFTSDDLCFPPSNRKQVFLAASKKGTDDHLGARKVAIDVRRNQKYANNPAIQWPNGHPPQLKYLSSPTSHRLTFRTTVCRLGLYGSAWKRKDNYNVKYPVYRMSVSDKMGVLCGYIDVPDPATRKIPNGRYEFAVLSRSTVDGVYEPGPDALVRKRRGPMLSYQSGEASWGSREPLKEARVEKGNFDSKTYDETRPWCMFNVMMIEWERVVQGLAAFGRSRDVAHRVAIGRVHVDAILASRGTEMVVCLD